MALFNRTTPEPPAVPPPATPPVEPGVSRAEFDEKFTRMMGAIENLAQRPVVVNQPAPAAPAYVAPPEITDEELTEAITSGRGAEKVKELVQRKLDAARRDVSAEVQGMRDYGAMAFSNLAERSFFLGLDEEDRAVFKRFEDEVKQIVNQCEPQLRGVPNTWETALNVVVGHHRKELEAERVEAALRRHAEDAAAAQAPQPGRSGGRQPSNDDTTIPTVQDFVGGIKGFEDLTEGEFIRKINRGKPAGQRYKDWADYYTRGKDIDAQLAALATGDDEAAA
jgi:hypothetical protein